MCSCGCQHHEKLHEQKRIAGYKLEQVQKKESEIRKRNDELLKYDPELFFAEMNRNALGKNISQLKFVPEECLAPLLPALARTYPSLARETLLQASGKDELDAA